MILSKKMDDKSLLSQLEELAKRLGMKVRYEPFKLEGPAHAGAFCRINGEDVIFINKKATPREKIHILIDAVKRCDLSEVYILPSLREILDKTDQE